MRSVPPTNRSPRSRRPRLLVATFAWWVATQPLASQDDAGVMFERVVDSLAADFHDVAFRTDGLPDLAARFRSAARAAADRAQERAIVHAFLRQLRTSHVALYTRPTYDALMADLNGERRPTLGLELRQSAGRFFVHTLLEGGPAHAAGLRVGDRVLAIDGAAPGRSARLDGRSDDAALDDPPQHRLLVGADDVVVVTTAAATGERRDVRLVTATMSARDAIAASANVVERDGARLGYVHVHYMHVSGLGAELRAVLRGPLANCDGLLLDLRGRGGSAAAIGEVIAVLDGRRAAFAGPVVLLVDRATRSAKEMLAAELRRRGRVTIVGERTAGAVVPATFVAIGDDDVLMYPATTLPRFTDEIEGVGVVPDVAAPAPGDDADGRDPIRDAGLERLLVECAARTPGR
jgi:carboxyl-terminal processing protease